MDRFSVGDKSAMYIVCNGPLPHHTTPLFGKYIYLFLFCMRKEGWKCDFSLGYSVMVLVNLYCFWPYSRLWTACTHGYCVKSASETLMGFGNISIHKIMCHTNIAYWDREKVNHYACGIPSVRGFYFSVSLFWFFHVANGQYTYIYYTYMYRRSACLILVCGRVCVCVCARVCPILGSLNPIKRE